MAEVGRIYLLKNASMPGLLKIGYTSGTVEDRMSQLMTTGVPTSFECVCQVEVDTPHLVEASIHRALSSYRLESNREFFRLSESSAIETIQRETEPYATRLRDARERRQIEWEKRFAEQRRRDEEEYERREPQRRAEMLEKQRTEAEKSEQFRLKSERENRDFNTTIWVIWGIFMVVSLSEESSMLKNDIVSFVVGSGFFWVFAFMISFFIMAFRNGR